MNCANIHQATEKDFALQRVKNYCSTGWPKTKKNVPCGIRSYEPPRDTLHTADGIVFDSDRIVIPVSLWSHMLNLIHESYFWDGKVQDQSQTACLLAPNDSRY